MNSSRGLCKLLSRAAVKSSRVSAAVVTSISGGRFPTASSAVSFPSLNKSRHFSSLVSPDGEEGEPVELTEALASEIAEEAAEQEVDTELEDVKALILKTFDIEDTPGRGIVTLRSKEGTMPHGESIEVVFDCQDEAEGDPMDSLDAFEGLTSLGNDNTNAPAEFGDEDDDMEDADEINYGINFNIAITKPNGNQLLIDAVAGQQLELQAVQYVSAENNKALQGGVEGEVDHELYGGPVLDQLDEGLQESLYDWLEDRHVDDDLCFFILSYARYKEQNEYVHWLHNMLKFAEK